MLETTDIQNDTFNNLPSISAADSWMGQKSNIRLKEICDVIADFHLESDVGILLLHKHIKLGPNERLVGRYDNEVIKVIPLLVDETVVVPTAWKFSRANDNGSPYTMTPLEYADVLTLPSAKAASRRLCENHKFIMAYAAALDASGLLEHIGISARYEDTVLGVLKDQIIVETTDEETREHILTVGEINNPHNRHLAVARWVYSGVLNSLVECNRLCSPKKECH